jgi:hypothetical protein
MAVHLTSSPAYPHKKQGVVLVVGGATCAVDDQERARVLCPVPFDVIAVNGAWPMIIRKPQAFAVVTCDSEAIKAQYPGHLELHQYSPIGEKSTHADYCWTGGGGLQAGSSSLCAAIVARSMGYSTIILCGVPLTRSGYHPKYAWSSELSEFKESSSKKINGTLLSRHSNWATHQKAGNLTGIYSMSGHTRDLLGEPDFQALQQ